MGTMTQTYARITARVGDNRKSAIHGLPFLVVEDCANDYHKDRLPFIPAGTPIIGDFAGDFGMYGLVEVNGALHKVKIDLHELHKVNFGDMDARNEPSAPIAQAA